MILDVEGLDESLIQGRRHWVAPVALVIAVLSFLAAILIGAHRIRLLQEDVIAIHRAMRSYTETNKALSKSITLHDKRLAKLLEDASTRPVIHVKYGTVYNTDGEVVIESEARKKK